MNRELILEVRGVVKSFLGTRALKSVDFDVRAGEIHGLVGANGAGKSTLVKILAGVYPADGGEILVDGKPAVIDSVEAAGTAGLRFVHQQHVVVPSLNGVENALLGQRLPRRWMGLVDWKKARRQAADVLERTGFNVNLDVETGRLSVAEQKLVEITRALAQRARVIVLDEPSASLGDEEVDQLMRDLRRLADSGIAIVYISHRLEEVIQLSDRITVLRNGENVGTVSGNQVTKQHLVELIVGEARTDSVSVMSSRPSGAELIAAEDVHWGNKLRGVSLTLHAGEVVGLAGLVGSGRTELAMLLFGAHAPDEGRILRSGRETRWKSPADAIASGVAMVPEDRHVGGLVLDMSIARNISLPSLPRFCRPRWSPLLAGKEETKAGREQIDRLGIRATGPTQSVSHLSGGNQQKVVLAKWLARDAEVLILDEPTHGVDVGAKADIYRLIADAAAEGAGVLLITSELADLVDVCDRVLVLCAGRIGVELSKDELSEESMLHACFGQVEAEGAERVRTS